jgi:hypothetical protein
MLSCSGNMAAESNRPPLDNLDKGVGRSQPPPELFFDRYPEVFVGLITPLR